MENKFTGWADVDLTDKGIEEAKAAGELLKNEGFTFDKAFTSVQKRAIRTLWITLDGMDLMWIPVERSWKMNERFYGGLTGMNKAETAKKYGDDQVLIWRRSYDIPPPELDKSSEYYPGNHARYAGLSEEEHESGVTAMKHGAVDFLLKPVENEVLFAAIAVAIEKDRDARELFSRQVSAREMIETLTGREKEIMNYVVTGTRNKEIAYQLQISEKTVKAHRGKVMHKSGAKSIVDLVTLSELAGGAPVTR